MLNLTGLINFQAATHWLGQPDPLAQEEARLIEVGLERAVDLRFGFRTRTDYDVQQLTEAAMKNRIVALRPVSNGQAGELRGIQLRTGSVTTTEAYGWVVRLGDAGATVPLGQKPVVLRNDEGRIRVVPDRT